MMQSSIEDGEDGEDSNDVETNKENTQPSMEKEAAPTRKRKRKHILCSLCKVVNAHRNHCTCNSFLQTG